MKPVTERDPDWTELPMDDGHVVDGMVQRCATGDRAAFSALYSMLSHRFYGYAMRLLRDPQLASDAVHDTFLQIWKECGRFDASRGRAEAWMVSLLRYRSIDILRERGRETISDQTVEQSDAGPGPFEELLSSEQGTALHRCLATLESDQRHVIVLAFLDGLSHSELAVRLARPLGTVKSLVRRALLGLRRCLEP